VFRQNDLKQNQRVVLGSNPAILTSSETLFLTSFLRFALRIGVSSSPLCL
jgi:hypothetical protein